ncbi:MAG: cell division topological specificity factor MinE [Chloroflexota bacterium]|nr:MAG: cell division topological specificity factor MinE [Chloroflexota bacterium]
MRWFDSLFRRNPPSAQIAKSRLKVAIQIDRNNLSPELINMIQDDIVRAISQRIDIDRDGMKISTERDEGGQRLIADIPIKAVRAKAASGE